MSTFKSTSTHPLKPDPAKHVNYVQGMVLGVDDFTQEFTYLSERAQWVARDLLGYGTVSGLRVTVETENEDHAVNVAAGAAVSPSGQMIRVASAQCANLNKWVQADKNKQELIKRLGSGLNGQAKLYVVLCYRECLTDDVPIPGEPCRSEEDLMAPSRLKDDFKLELRFDPPRQCEEDAVRAFARWLRTHIEITGEPGGMSLENFLNEIRSAAHPLTSPPCSAPEFMSDYSPPVSLRISSSVACEYLRAAFRVWATEFRPRWRPDFFKGNCCAGDQSTQAPQHEEDCVLLAELNVPLADGRVSGRVAVDEERRPYLLHLRLLQELLFCGRPKAGPTGGIPPASHPSVGDFVEHPTGLGKYSIVAAGCIKGDGESQYPVYNGLTVIITSPQIDSQLLVTFKGYEMPMPDGSFQYVVKALPVFNVDVKNPTVSFDSFTPNGFILRITNGAALVKSKQVMNLEFMIEVSRYEKE